MASKFLEQMAEEERKRKETNKYGTGGGQTTRENKKETAGSASDTYVKDAVEKMSADLKRKMEAGRNKRPVVRESASRGLSLPATSGTVQTSEPQGLSLPEIPVTSGNLMPEWAQRMVDRYKPENNQNIRQNPVAAAEEKKRSAAGKGVDWRGIPMSQSPDGVRSQGQEGPTAADWGELAKQTVLAGVGQVSKAAGSTLSAAEQLVTRPLGWLMGNPELYKDGVLYVINQNAEKAAAQVNENLNQAAEKTGKTGELVAKFGPATVAALPQAAMAYLTAGQSLAAQTSTAGLQAASTAAQLTGGAALANTALEAVKNMATNPSFQYSFLNTVGGEYEQALEDGADVKTAYAYATITALMNSVVEIGGEGGIDKLPEKDKHILLEWVKDMFDEGKEEVIQGAISQLMQNTVYQKGNPAFSMTNEEAIINPGRMAEDFAGGAVVGGILGGGQLAVNAAIDSQERKNAAQESNGTDTGEVQQAYLSNMTEQAQTGAEADRAGTEAAQEGGGAQVREEIQPEARTAQETAGNGPEELVLPAPSQAETERSLDQDPGVRKAVSLKEGPAADAAQAENRGGFTTPEGRSVSRADRSLLENLGKVTGSDIRVVPQAELDRIAGRSGENGVQIGDRLYISESTDRPMAEIAKHELTHRLQDVAPEEYGAFRDYVAEVHRADGTLERYIDGMIRSRESAGISMTREQALDEIAADYAGKLMVDEKAVRRLAGENRGLLEKLLDGLREFIGKIRRKLGGGKNAQTEELERAAKLWQDALEAAGRSTEYAGRGQAEARPSAYEDQAVRKTVSLKEGPVENAERAETTEQPERLRLRSADDSSETKIESGKISEKTDTGRYSSKGDVDLEKEIDRLRRQNQRLKEQMKRTDRAEVNREAVERKAREFLKEYGSEYDKQTLYDRIGKLYDGIANQTLSESDMRTEARSIAEDILSGNRTQTNELYEEYRDLRKELRTRGISIAPEYRANLESAGGYEDIRKRYFGSMRLGDNGTAVDRVYDDLASRYPEFFPADITHPADQLLRITDVLDSLRPVMGNAYEGVMDRAADYLAGELLEQYFDTPEKAPTFADRQARKMAEQRAEDREKMRAAVEKERRNSEKKLNELKKKNREYYQLERENWRIKEQNRRIKDQMMRTDAIEFNRRSVEEQAKSLLRDYRSRYGTKELADQLEALYGKIGKKSLTEAGMKAEAQNIAENIMRGSTGQLGRMYMEIQRELRGKEITLDKEYWAELRQTGGYSRLARKNAGRLRLVKDGESVSNVYRNMAENYPYVFPADITHPAEQLLRISDALDDGQLVMEQPLGPELKRAAEHVAGDILERYYETPEKQLTFADKQAKQAEERLERQKKRDREYMRERIEKERELREKKLEEMMKKNREFYRKVRENRELRQLQQKTLKQLQWLSKNRDKAPSELRAEFDKVLGDIDVYAVHAANEMNWSKKHQATWRDLADMYKDAQENDPNFMPSKELERIMKRLSADKIGDLDVGALQDLYKAAVGLRTEYYNRKNVINDEQGRMFADVYESAKEEIRGASGGVKPGEESYDMSKADRFINMEQLTPMNYLERMGGWNAEGQFYSMARQLEQGERDMRRYRVQAESMLEDFLTKNAEWVKRSDGQGKDAVWYEIEVPELLELKMGDKPIFGDMVKVYMTPAQKVHMYLESKDYDNLRHMAGGRTFADKALYSKGKRQEAFAQGKTVRLAPETVKKLVSDLTVEEKAMAAALEKYYNQFAAEKINEKSNILYGYDKAMSSHYAPIYSNQNYVAKEIGIYDTTAEGVGRLKARQYSQNPSYQISAMDAFERHVDQTSRFVGMSIPARNWDTLLKWREKNNSMKDVISHKWGDASVKYIENLLNTLQGGGTDSKKTLESFGDKMLSNYITGVFGANPGIVLKQAASFPQFAAALGWENLPGAFGKANEQIINAYTSELAYRTLGYATPETAQLKNNPNWLDTNKATQFALRGGAITAMDAATVKRAWPWAERKVRKEHPGLEMGTREQIEAGESPFYKKVAEEFENAVSLTQPMYDEMHRPDIMKNSGGLQRAFTMFKTVPLQQYNTLRRAFGEAAAASREAKNAKGTEAQKQADEKARKAARTAGAAVTATLASVLMLEGVEFLNQWYKNAAKGYRDDDDELTAESALTAAAQKAAGDLTGMVVGGKELTDVLANIFTGKKRYGIEIPGGEQLNDAIKSIQSAAGTIEKIVGDGFNVVENGGDLKEYFRRNAGDYAGAAKEIAEKLATYIGGLPVENVEKYIMGGLRMVSPELWEGAQSAFNTPEKNDLAGLKGKALESRVGSIMSTRGVDISGETAAELAALYQAGYKNAIPSNTPDSLTVNEESRKLTAHQRQTYDLTWSETLADCMDKLIASRDYQEESEEARARILEKLYDYAREKAKEAVFDDYEAKESTKKADAVIQAGGLPGEWAAWATAPEKDMKDSENKLREIRELRYSIWGDEVKDAALKGVLSEKDYERLQGAKKAGISIEKWCDVYEAIAKQKIKRTGKSGSPSQEDVINALKGSGLTERQKDAIWEGYGWKGEREK